MSYATFSVRKSPAWFLINIGAISKNFYGRYQRRDFSKVQQTPQEKQAALAKAESKRERKRVKRFRNDVNSFANNHCLSVEWFPWKFDYSCDRSA